MWIPIFLCAYCGSSHSFLKQADRPQSFSMFYPMFLCFYVVPNAFKAFSEILPVSQIIHLNLPGSPHIIVCIHFRNNIIVAAGDKDSDSFLPGLFCTGAITSTS